MYLHCVMNHAPFRSDKISPIGAPRYFCKTAQANGNVSRQARMKAKNKESNNCCSPQCSARRNQGALQVTLFVKRGAECLYASDPSAQDEIVDIVGTFIGVDALQIGHVSHNWVFI